MSLAEQQKELALLESLERALRAELAADDVPQASKDRARSHLELVVEQQAALRAVVHGATPF